MSESRVERFFRLRDEAERTGQLPATFDDLQLLAHPPAVSSQSGMLARQHRPDLYARLVDLHAQACRVGAAAGPKYAR